MFKKLFIGWGIVALLAIAGMIYLVIHTTKNNMPTTFAQCKDRGGTIQESYPEVCVWNNARFENPEQRHTLDTEQKSPELELDQNGNPTFQNSSTYTNKTAGYSFNYPTDLFVQSKQTIVLPHNNQKITVDEFRHEIPVEYCALSGVCTPTTMNMKWGSAQLAIDRAQLLKSAIAAELVEKTINDFTVYEYAIGAEGEGIIYEYIEQAGKPLLLMYRTYMDENILTKYKTITNKGYIGIKDQEQIFNTIIGSLD